MAAAPILFPARRAQGLRRRPSRHGRQRAGAAAGAGSGCDVVTATRQELDLRRQRETEDWLAAARPDAVFVAAATVGGILANDTRPAEFLYDNLMIAAT